MECPVCGDGLHAVEKYGVEIDICPGCKGVWLDRGELDTIIETAGDGTTSRSGDGDRQPQPKKKTTKQGLLGGLMDAIGGGGD